MKTIWKLIALGVLGACLTLVPAAVQATIVTSSAQSVELRSHSAMEPASITGHTASNLEAGRTFYTAGQFSDAIAAWQVAVAYYAASGDSLQQALGLSYLSLAHQELNQWDAAQDAITQSVALLDNANRPVSPILWAQALNTKASLLLHTGHPETALETWEQAQTFYEQAGDSSGALGSQINQAQALQNLGFYRRARQHLEKINQQLAVMPDSDLKISSLRSLGIALQVVGDWRTSYDVLAQSLAIARQIDSTKELSSTLLNIGKLAANLGEIETAISYFEVAEQEAINPIDQVHARLSHLQLSIQQEQWQQATALIPQIHQQLVELPPSRDSIYAVVHFAHTLTETSISAQLLSNQALGQLLASSIQAARELKDPSAEAHALRQLGQVYAQAHQWTEAIDLTQQSLAIARTTQADDIIAQSAWQLGRLLKQQSKPQEAIAVYTEAVNALQSLRGDLVAISSDIQFSFRESVEPVYRELVALLIDDTPSQSALVQARELIEGLQLAELDNFLRQACLDIQPEQIDQVDRHAAIVYPIILPDRLAVILSMPGQPLRYYTTSVSQSEVDSTLRKLLAALHPSSDTGERLRYSQQVYNWLIRPAETDQVLTETQTLVFVLDGLLRNVPIAALHDGEHYLIEKYAVALSPGLQLMPARSLDQQQVHAVVGGISESRGGFSALPAVGAEVNNIAQLVSASTLLNQEFTNDEIAKRLETSSTNIVHLATHGQFSSNQDETFLLTWEGQMNIWDLAELLQRRENSRAEAIELLVLSACDTAAGDDRAVLGLAGLAVKSGARSTLATLWPVKDQAASQLMIEFYQQLQEPGVTKAEALRRAQLTLLANPSYDDPFFWSAYVLVGNWL
ncbi:CHAT domain-containing protein [Oculatella sp. LEGE 06141]|uniref:CHAT domain-containing protein n=1 Tax=Oculatella sp. LEGE 06141 TaxID=1828648 RepID=UPI00187DDFFD|nr:CHAT domain-containing protein [Oculatella sp. LEGE 06141]MBE9181161.1 CHAT domain-containing protein [Oculatella sp. LEGE 06141]